MDDKQKIAEWYKNNPKCGDVLVLDSLESLNGLPQPTQLDRIEAKLDELLAKKKRVVNPMGSKDDYPEWFEEIWSEYPKRSGGNPKQRAFQACNARTPQSMGYESMIMVRLAMLDGVRAYIKFCDATGKTGTEYVMQAATFFGPDKHYENDWKIPDTVKKSAIPRDNDEMQAWAIKKGLRPANQGESWNQYRAYVEGEA